MPTQREESIIYGNVSDGGEANATFHMPFNATINIFIRIANDSIDAVSSTQLFPFALQQQTPRLQNFDNSLSKGSQPMRRRRQKLKVSVLHWFLSLWHSA